VITAEGRIEDGDGKLYAHGTSSCLIVGHPGPSASAATIGGGQAVAAALGDRAMVNLIS
jgi:hypothetical protein